jgi:DNA-binding beta-propeller fold protein YncE
MLRLLAASCWLGVALSSDEAAKVTIESGGVIKIEEGGSLIIGAPASNGPEAPPQPNSPPPIPPPSPPPIPPAYDYSDSSRAVVTTLAGSIQGYVNAIGIAAKFWNPYGLAIAPDGSKVYIGDVNNHRIRAVTLSTGEAVTFAGSGSQAHVDAVGTSAAFKAPQGVALTPDGQTLLVADNRNNRIRSINLSTREVTTLAGSGSAGSADGTGAAAAFNQPQDVAVTPDGSTAIVVDFKNNAIRSINLATGAVTTLAGSGSLGFADGIGTDAIFRYPYSVAIMPDASAVLVADQGNNRIRSIALPTAAVTTLAGSGSQGSADGIGTAATFFGPKGVAVTPDGMTAIVADMINQRIRTIDLSTGAVSTLAGGTQGGNNGVGTSARFYYPQGVAVTPDGSTVLVADQQNHRIRSIAIPVA